jgi:hypothetical protein
MEFVPTPKTRHPQSHAGPKGVADWPEEGRKPPRELRIKIPRFSLKLVIICVVVICVVGGGIFFALNRSGHDPLPYTVKQQAHFQLYYPTFVPDGFRFDEAAYDPSTKVVTYDYSTINGNRIYFSLQPKPAGFNFDKFNKKQLTGTSQVATPLGTATVGVLQEQTVSSIVTDKTWIIISSGEKVSLDQLQQVSKSLKPVK